MDLLTMKYPGKAQDIEFNRANGYTDDEIEAEYQARFQVNLFNGYSEQEIETAYGITPESKKAWQEATRESAYGILAESFDLTKKQVVDTVAMSHGIGVNPTMFLADRNLYNKAKGMIDSAKETQPLVEPPRNMQDMAKATMTGAQNEYASQSLTMADNLLYPTARLASSIERMGFGIAGLPYHVASAAAGVLQDAGVIDKESEVAKGWKAYAEYLSHPEEHGIITPWVAGKQSRRREESYSQSFMGGILNDVGDAVIDFMGLVMSMNVAGAISAGSVTPLNGATMLQRIGSTVKTQGVVGFLTTPGDIQERFQAGAYRVAYNLTPYVANNFASGAKAVATDFLLNSFLTMPTYVSAFKNSMDPKEFISMALPQMIVDLGMSWHTRGSPETYRKSMMNRSIDEFAKAKGVTREDARFFVENNWKNAEEAMDRKYWQGTGDTVFKEGDTAYDRYTGDKVEITSVRSGSVFAKGEGETIFEYGKGYLLNEPPVPQDVRVESFTRKHTIDTDGKIRVVDGETLAPTKGKLLNTQVSKGKNKAILLQEVMKDPTLTPEDRAEVKDLMYAPAEEPLTLDDVRRLPITDAAVRLGFAGVKVAPISYDDVPISKILRSRDPLIKAPALELVKDVVKNSDMGDDIAWEQRQENMWLLSKTDLRSRSTKTLAVRNMMNEAAKENPELKEFLNSRDFKTLNMTSMGEMSMKELRELNTTLSENAATGREIFKLRQADERERLDSNGMKLRDTLKVVKGDGKAVVRRDDLASAKKRSGFKQFYWLSITPSRLFDLLDGVKNGAGFIKKLFYDETNRRENEAKYHMQNRRNYVMQTLRNNNLTTKNLAETRTVGEGNDALTITRSEAMGIYAHSLVNHQKKGLIDLNGFSEKQINNVVASLSDGEKAVTRAIIKDFADNFERIDGAFVKYANVGMDYVPDYTPIYFLFRTGAEGSFIDSEKENQLQMVQAVNHLKRQYAKNGFTKTRIDEYPEMMRGAIDTNLFSVWNRALQVHEHFSAYAEHIRDLRRTLDWRGADNISNLEHIVNQYGSTMKEIIEAYVNRIADPSFYKADVATNTLNRAVKAIRQNVAVVYLSYNLLTMGKQVMSIPFYAAEAGPHFLLASIGRAMIPGEFYKMRKLTESLDPQINERGLDRSIEELRIEWENKDTMRGRIARFGMKGITAMDKMTVTIGWNAVFDAYKAKGFSDVEAAEKAQFATLQTQPASHPKDIPHLYASNNEILNLFLQFTNQLNKVWNITTYDLYAEAKNGEFSKALTMTVGMTLAAALIHGMSGGGNEDDDFGEFLAKSVGAQIGNSIPIFGRDIVGYFQGYSGGEIPTSKAMRNIFGGVSGIWNGEFDEKTAGKLWEGLSVMWLGMPVTGPKRAVQFAQTGDPANLFGQGKKPKKKKSTLNF